MSDLIAGGNGRAANGGARTTGGPVPVSGIRTPQMIMSQRREREAAKAAEEQRKAEEEQRRKSAERRVAAAGVAGQPIRDPGSQRQPETSAYRQGEANPAAYPLASQGRERAQTIGGENYPMTVEAQDTSAGAARSRPRATSQSQPQPRPAQYQPPPPPPPPPPPVATDVRRPQASQSHTRQHSATTGPSQARAGPSTVQHSPQAGAGQSGSQHGHARSTRSSFPHAFERWEQLSSHWEGLTLYWIRRLEQNSEEVRREPLAQQMSRQITDLSAAGANLFHAVVELQRLRASSERKFQRWFYEHRQEQERAQEREAEFERTLRTERDARHEAVANMERMATEKNNAERMVAEMRRELQISKEEARRAWEELGRREQEERDRTFSLREGQPTVVGGVQVVPMTGGTASRHGSISHRPHAAEEGYSTGTPRTSANQGLEQQFSYDAAQSPTDTDPFTERQRHAAGLHHEPDGPSLAQGTYVPSGAAAAPIMRPAGYSQPPEQLRMTAPLHHDHMSDAQQPGEQASISRPEAFYQQSEAYLHRETAGSVPEDVQSYVTSQGDETSEGDEEYVMDQHGNFILDEAGHRVPRRTIRQQESDEFDVDEDRRRELEHLQHYGTSAAGPSTYTTTSSGAQYGPNYSTAPDYSGAGYGNEWPGMRHHHPTRLSDVPEEDERSRTSPSRASLASRGRY